MGSLNQQAIVQLLEMMLVLIVSVTIHEFAHAITADRLGDDTPRSQGRISINPIDHLDPLGTIMMAISSYTGFGIGWGKPVQYNPGNLKNPRWDPLKIAIAGPISNIVQAVLFAGLVRLSDHFNWWDPGTWPYDLITLGVWINLALAIFNMIPIPPLDGSKVLSALLPTLHARRYDLIMGQIGFLLFLAIVFTHATSYIIGPPVSSVYHVLVGW